MTWWKRLNEIMSKKSMSPAELARKADIHEKLIYKYVDGKVDNPRGDTMRRLARALDVSEQELRFGIVPGNLVQLKKIPLLDMNKMGTLERGDEVLAAWDGVSVVAVPVDQVSENSFGVRIEGDRNAPAFQDQEIIICDPTSPIDPGKYVVAVVDNLNKGVFGRYRPDAINDTKRFRIIAEHPDYPEIEINEDNPGFVVARAVRHIRTI